MAGCATELTEVIRRYFCTGQGLVALVAGHGFMAASQREARFLMFRKCVVRNLEGDACVALFAAVPPRRGSELPIVFVLMTIHAHRVFDFEFCVLARGNMTRSALHRGVRKG